MQVDQDQKLLTVAQVAEQLHTSKQGVWAMIRRGELPAVRISPRRIRVHPADLEGWLSRRTSWRPQGV